MPLILSIWQIFVRCRYFDSRRKIVSKMWKARFLLESGLENLVGETGGTLGR